MDRNRSVGRIFSMEGGALEWRSRFSFRGLNYFLMQISILKGFQTPSEPSMATPLIRTFLKRFCDIKTSEIFYEIQPVTDLTSLNPKLLYTQCSPYHV